MERVGSCIGRGPALPEPLQLEAVAAKGTKLRYADARWNHSTTLEDDPPRLLAWKQFSALQNEQVVNTFCRIGRGV